MGRSNKSAACLMETPLGNAWAIMQDNALTGLWFADQKRDMQEARKYSLHDADCPGLFWQLDGWLKEYFSGKNPSIPFVLQPQGTDFQKRVWDLLLEIPYGSTCSYQDLAHEYARLSGKNKMSAQAIGQAVGRNPICLLIPCHRIIGKDGSLRGYVAGLERKKALLELEKQSNLLPQNLSGLSLAKYSR